MFSTADIRKLEAHARAGWPASEEVEFDGWLLGHSHGYSRRTNSVHVLSPGRQPMNQKLPACESWYAARSRPAYFKMTDADRDVDEFLERRDYTREALTQVRTADLAKGTLAASADRATDVEEWIEAFLAVRDPLDDEDAAAFAGIVQTIKTPTYLAVIREDESPAAVALGVGSEDMVGIFNVVTSPVHRRRGLGRAVTETVLAWAADDGATSSFLQVVEENTDAQALFGSLGFEIGYRYWYRRQAVSVQN